MGYWSDGRRWMTGTSKLVLGSSLAFAPGLLAAQTKTPAPSATPFPASQDENKGIADIIVTAQRREESLQRAALAVSAVGGEALARANVTDVTSLTKLVPSLIVQPATGTSVGFYLRGVGSLVGNAFTENPIAFNYNQVYIARPAAVLGTFYDLQRVEVLKGPQGTLYGRNATGGAINVIPNRPILDRRSLDLALETGDHASIRTQAAVNLPLGPTVAIRLAGQIAQRSGYLSDGYDDENGQAARGSVFFEPSSAFSALVSVDYFHQGGKGPGGVLVPGPLTPSAPPVDKRFGATDPRSTAALFADFPALYTPGLVLAPKDDGYVDSSFYGISGDFEADLGFARLTVIPAYRVSKPNYLSYSGGYRAQVDETSKQTSLEVRLTSPGEGRFKYVLGGYYFNEDQNSFNDFYPGLLAHTFFKVLLHNRSYAAFGQATYEVVPNFRLVAGGRYTNEDKDRDTTLTQLRFGVGPTTRTTGTASFKKFTYKAGFEWDVAPRSLLYGSVATGFKSGGFFNAAFDSTFGPENITAYTVGSKNRFFDNRVQVNLEGFYWDYKNQQINYLGPLRTSATTVGTGLVTVNAGNSRIFGAEGEFSFQITRSDLFTANVQLLDGKYTKFSFLGSSPTGTPPRSGCTITPSNAVTIPPPGRIFLNDCSGKPQINTPQISVNLSYEHTFDLTDDLSATFGGRSKIESSRFLSPEYLPEEKQRPYTSSDAFVTLASAASRLSLTAYVNNIEDRTVYAGTSVTPLLPIVYNILRPPRTYGLRLAASF